MRYRETISAGEILSTDVAKMFLRALQIETDEDAAIIEPMIAAAREYCENITGRAIVQRDMIAYPDKLRSTQRLPKPPIESIDRIEYMHANRRWCELDADRYMIDADSGELRIMDPPEVYARALEPVKIHYVAGYAPMQTPNAIRQAMLMLIGHWYTNRESVQIGAVTSVEVGVSTHALLKQYKVWWY